MIRSTSLLTAVLISGALAMGACGSDDGGDDKGESGGSGSSTYYGGYGGSGGSTYYGGSGGSDGGSAGSSQGGAAGGSPGGGLSPIDGSCQNHCGNPTPPPGGAKCYCDDSCIPIGDCCSDYDQYCDSGSGGAPSGGGGSGGSGGSPGGLTSCVGHCGDQGPVPGSSPSCYCDDLCIGNGDCCFDFNVACAFSGNGGSGGGSGTPSCVGHCGKITPVPGSNPPCYCDITCSTLNDCCPNYDTAC